MSKYPYQVSEAMKRRRRVQRDTEIVEMYCVGVSAPAIAKAFKLERCHVLKIIREMHKAGAIMKAKKGVS